ncbi:hypothetical protein Xaut_3732 [Xanthobacter versatilis]|uniref:Uncharacterized protein n=1 Tax=Xanthobacter autotrophicus (strain ATCC BAA-1158 / Py2) TaxID=78245 RepID=A7ILR5_XANP2|nr:hypothetical protein Xaut_3732 [Xanthobacter autotrophicus Py2]
MGRSGPAIVNGAIQAVLADAARLCFIGVLAELTRAAAGKPRVVVDDVRFPNEVEAIRVLGGVVIEVTPAAAANPATLQHVSEQGGLDWDFSIINPMGPSFFG